MTTVIGIMEKLVVRGLNIVNIGIFLSLQINSYSHCTQVSLSFNLNPAPPPFRKISPIYPFQCRYAFGDVHLGQSCRLKNSSADLLLHYI